MTREGFNGALYVHAAQTEVTVNGWWQLFPSDRWIAVTSQANASTGSQWEDETAATGDEHTSRDQDKMHSGSDRLAKSTISNLMVT